MVATRLGDVDGVSFEAVKWQAVLAGLGHQLELCAGDLGAQGSGTVIPEMHFEHPAQIGPNLAAFDVTSDPTLVRAEIERLAKDLERRLAGWLDDVRPDLLVVQNGWAIPMHLPLGLALARLVAERRLPTIGHHHDYWWERARYANCIVPDLLARAFPPALPTVSHVSINSHAAAELRRRRGIDSTVIPNVFDFDRTIRGEEAAVARALRSELALVPNGLLVVQPTRVVPRKGIELAIELLARLDHPGSLLLITSPAEEEGREYLVRLGQLASRLGVDMRHEPERFRPSIANTGANVPAIDEPGGPAHSLIDAYIAADLITYPSLYEGFGNALVEAMYFRKLVVVNRYPVYVADIAPLGVRFIELDGEVTDAVVAELRAALADPARRAAAAEHNFLVGRDHLSYGRLERELVRLLPHRTATA